MANIIEQLQELTSSRHRKGKEHTHVSLHPQKGSYYLEPFESSVFMNEYCKVIHEHSVPGILEKFINASPIVADIDLRDDYEIGMDIKPLYTDNDIISTIRIFFTVFETLLPDLESEELVCVIMEKDPYIDGNRVKHGFHLQFPYICLSINDQKNHLFPLVKEQVNLYFRNNKAFDDGILNGLWLLYGSSKPGKEPYVITKILNSQLGVISAEDAFRAFTLRDARGSIVQMTESIEYYYPMLLSTNCQFRTLKNINIDIFDSSLVRMITRPEYHIQNKENFVAFTDEQYSKSILAAQRLLPMLDDKRASDWDSWIRVGFALFNSCGPSIEILEMWLQFSQRTVYNNFDKQGCIECWKTMGSANHGNSSKLGTLFWYAQQDSPVEFSKYQAELKSESIFAAITGSHYDLACLLLDDYGEFYRCTSITQKRWYMYENHTWKLVEEGTQLRQMISTQLRERYKETRKKYQKQMIEEGDDNREKLEKRIKEISSVIGSLGNSSFKNAVLRECCEVFYDAQFENELNTNPYLVAFKNGIYDLQSKEFRCGDPTDNISMQMPIEYKEYTVYDPAVQQIFTFFEQLFPDKSLREYVLDLMCIIMRGGNFEKLVQIWTGTGNNGKSIMEALIHGMLGCYAQTLPTASLVGKRGQSGQADPVIARTPGAKWLVAQEPNDTDHLNVGVLKEMSGNDKMFARELFQKGKDVREIIPMFKLTLVCNTLPNLLNADQAAWNRVVVVPFESTFVRKDKLKGTVEEQLELKQFPMDPKLSEKIPGMLAPFAWVLIQRYNDIGGKIREPPMKVRMATNAYRSRNDMIQQFIDDNIESDPTGKLSISDLYTTFKSWYVDICGFEKRDVPRQMVVRDHFVKKWGQPTNKSWTGIRFQQEDFEHINDN